MNGTEVDILPKSAPPLPLDGHPLLSIIIPARNNYSQLLYILSSFHRDIAERIQWIIIDDGSDKRLEDQLPDTEYVISFLRNERSMGAGYSRNLGLTQAQGHYILFFDSDDVLRIDTIKKTIPILETRIYDLLIFKYHVEQESIVLKHMNNNDMRSWNRLSSNRDPDDVFKLTTYPWNRIVRRKLLEDKAIRFQNTVVFNDIFAVWKITEAADRILLVPEPICIYANMNNNMRIAGIKDERRLQIFIPLLALMEECRDNPRQIEELFHLAWKKRSIAIGLCSWKTKFIYLSLLYIYLRRFSRETIRQQTIWRRTLISNSSIFKMFTLGQLHLNDKINDAKKRIVNFIWRGFRQS